MDINVSNNNDQQEYDRLLADVKSLESEVMQKLDILAKDMPQIYASYANITRESLDAAITILSLKNDTKNSLRLAAELGARSIEAFGAWKASRQHNKMLDKFLTLKKNFTASYSNQIEKSLTEATTTLQKIKKLFHHYVTTQYDLSTQDSSTILRVSNLLLRNLVLYRTALFIKKLCEYLKAECKAWKNGQQTSNVPRTDYYIVNGEIINELFGSNHYKALENAANSLGELSGAQILLLSDPQLCVYALKDTLCKIDTTRASYPVGLLLSNNSGINYYIDQVSPIAKELTEFPGDSIYFFCLCTFIAIVALCIWYVPGDWWVRVVIMLIALSGLYKITSKNMKKLKTIYITESLAHVAEVDEIIEGFCGKTKSQQIDYSRKNTWASTLKTFFK